MDLSVTLVGIVLIIIAIWAVLELKRFRHRLLAIFLIALLLFTYLSFSAAFRGKTLDFSSLDGIKEAGAVYYSWLGSIFSNVKTLSSNAVRMDWGVNNTGTNTSETPPNSAGN